ncbi:MAG: S26 family signal peptidase [Pirellula sp.]|nr:S26 family signal peptidase [Pirellula sp.]
MEPHLLGPRLLFQNSTSQFYSSYTLDSLRPNMPIVCQYSSERDASFDLLAAMSMPESVTEGETVRYYLWKRMAAMRAAENEDRTNEKREKSFQGIERGDLVVIQAPDEESREVKRIVGFPGEIIDIMQGDLWVNGTRWSRNVKQILQHAVLLDYGDAQSSSYWNYGGWIAAKTPEDNGDEDGKVTQVRTYAPLPISLSSSASADLPMESPVSSFPVGGLDFRLRSGGLITNELRWNAHDSHTLVPVQDIGMAIELENTPSDWQLAVTVRSQDSTTIMVERSGETIIVSTAQKEVSKKISADLQSHWLLFMKVDGDTIVADEISDWIREANLSSQSVEDDSSFESDGAPFSIECHHGDVDIRQWAVFRDLYYRGAGDSPEQRLLANDGIIVLGDNISISDDSRQRWEDGLSTEAIRGVVDLRNQGWDALLKQKNNLLFDRNRDQLRDVR